MKVQELMSAPVVTVAESEPADRVARFMLDRAIGSVVVVDDGGNALGIVTERDFSAREPMNPFQFNRAPRLFGKPVRDHGLESLYAEARAMPARRLMRPFPATLATDDALERAVDLMNRHDVLHLVVLRNRKPVGILTRRDFLRLAVAPAAAPLAS